MALPIRIFSYQAQLADSLKEQYPGQVFVNIPFQSLRNVPAPERGKFLKWNNAATGLENADGTVNPPAVSLEIVDNFPGGPANNDVVILTKSVGNNSPGVYQYSSADARWNAIVARISVPSFPSGAQLPAVATGQFILTAQHNANPPGLYSASGGVWERIASVYNDQPVRDLITALTGRVTNVEAENPVKTLVLNGSVLTVTFQDNTTQDIQLPAGGAGTGTALATSSIVYGLTASIDDLRGESVASQNLAKTAANTAFTANNSVQNNIGAQGERSSRTADNLSSGSYVNFSAPAAPADKYYNAWITIPSENFTKLKVQVASGDGEGEIESDDWVEGDDVQIDNTTHKLFVRNTEIASGESMAFIFQVFR